MEQGTAEWAWLCAELHKTGLSVPGGLCIEMLKHLKSQTPCSKQKNSKPEVTFAKGPLIPGASPTLCPWPPHPHCFPTWPPELGLTVLKSGCTCQLFGSPRLPQLHPSSCNTWVSLCVLPQAGLRGQAVDPPARLVSATVAAAASAHQGQRL